MECRSYRHAALFHPRRPSGLSAPGAVTHVRPIVFVETWLSLEECLIDVQDEDLAFLIQREPAPRNRNQLVAQAAETSKREDNIRHPSGGRIDHDLVHLPQYATETAAPAARNHKGFLAEAQAAMRDWNKLMEKQATVMSTPMKP